MGLINLVVQFRTMTFWVNGVLNQVSITTPNMITTIPMSITRMITILPSVLQIQHLIFLHNMHFKSINRCLACHLRTKFLNQSCMNKQDTLVVGDVMVHHLGNIVGQMEHGKIAKGIKQRARLLSVGEELTSG